MTSEIITYSHIETLTKEYAAARAVVADRVNALDDEARAMQRRKIPGIKSALASAEDAKSRLAAAIQSAPHLFENRAMKRTMRIAEQLKGSLVDDWLKLAPLSSGQPYKTEPVMRSHVAAKKEEAKS